MSRYRIDPVAYEDMEAIYDYIAGDNPSAADRLLDRFHDKFRLLATHPLLGQVRPELREHLRSVSVGNYVIYFTPIPDGIAVARVIHGARDIEAQF